MYSDCVAGVMKALKKVKGLATVLDYEPQAIHKSPCALVLFDSTKPTAYSTSLAIDEHSLLVRVVVARADNEGAEKILKTFIDAVPPVVRADPYLDGLFGPGGEGGMMKMHPQKDAVGVYLNYGKVLYRGVDFFLLIKEITAT